MTRIAIIEDNKTYRSALEAYIGSEADLEVLYSVGSYKELNSWPKHAAPNVMVLDIALGNESGIAIIPEIKKRWPGCGILMLTIFEDEERIMNAIEAGAIGFLLKNDLPENIIEAIRKVGNGEGILNGQVARKMFNHISGQKLKRKDVSGYNLTKREKEVVQLLMEGLSYKEIAQRCFISMSTLNSHIINIYNKMDVHSRAEISAKLR
jgi:DNA-binding NarL/FixJ family response regulator